MRHAKKIISVFLALIMVMGTAEMVFASNTDTGNDTKGSITISNPAKDVAYKGYKIFDVRYAKADGGDLSAISYAMKSSSVWFNVILDYMGTTEGGNTVPATPDDKGKYAGKGITLTPAAGDSSIYVVTIADAAAGSDVTFSAADFANYLNTHIPNGENGISLSNPSDGDTSVKIAVNLDLGYYLVTGTYTENNVAKTKALANLTSTTPDVTIQDKNDISFEKKADDISVEVGQEVHFTIESKVPDATGFSSYIYKISDTMSDGLTFIKEIVVKIGGKEVHLTDITANTSAELTGNAIRYNDKGFDLSLDIMNETAGEDIKITYSAIVNEGAVAAIHTNTAVLTYSNDPTDSTKTSTITKETKNYSAKIIIDKYKSGDENTKLSGAKFVLYKEVTEGEGEAAVTKKQYYKYTEPKAAEGTQAAVNADVSWYELSENETVSDAIKNGKITAYVTDEKGAAIFKGIEDGTYYLLEMEAPKGYNLLDNPVEVVVDGDEMIKDGESKDVNPIIIGNPVNLTDTAKVENSTGSILPSTGGMGTTLLYTIGAVLVVSAAVLLIVRKRMHSEK